jgi:pSer/pThr/pTyr-binding forkhead associated (FHA) protein
MARQDDEKSSCTLQLLDSAQGHAIQTWQFSNCGRVTIGRASSNDIHLTDTQVSRFHVELVYGQGEWQLISHGRNGTQIEGIKVSEGRLSDRTIFQLGTSGPSFRFLRATDGASSMATVEDIDQEMLDFLVIDEERKNEEVQQIAESETFQKLKEAARRWKDDFGIDVADTDVRNTDIRNTDIRDSSP